MDRTHVILDLDGTLIETEEVWATIRRRFVQEHGGGWRDGAQAAMMGMRTEEWARYVHDELGVALSPDEIAREVIGRLCNRLAAALPVLPGAQAALERLAPAFTLGLATSSPLRIARLVLATAGWQRFFAAVVSADDVARGKPAPDVYLRAIEVLDTEPPRCAAVEDSGNGIRAAHSASLAVVAIPNREYPPNPQSLALAARVLPNLDALHVETVNALPEG